MRAFGFLSGTRFFADEELDFDTWSSEGYSMMCPCGSVVGVHLEQDNNEEEEIESEQEASSLNQEDSSEEVEDVLPSDEMASEQRFYLLESFHIESRKMLKYVSTCWLSMQTSVECIFKAVSSSTLYFLSQYESASD